MNDALSDERKTIVCAISSGLPTRLSGTVAVRPAFLSSVPVKRFSIPVSIGPGATILTRTPDEAASSAADLVSPSTACLLAEYREAPGCTSTAVGGRYVDDAAASLGKHHTHFVLHAEQRTKDICVEGRGVGFGSLFHHRAGCTLGAGAVDRNVQTAKTRDSLIDQVAHLLLMTHVRAQEFGLSAKLLEFAS